jgi:tetrahydromethanopterin S-methyltransferase subunit C
MLEQQILLCKFGVPLTALMFIIYGVDYLSKFGAVFGPSEDGDESLKDMVSILIRIIFCLTCVFGGGISLLKPNWASFTLIFAYFCFNILVQIVYNYGLS